MRFNNHNLFIYLLFRIQAKHAEVYCDGRSTSIKPLSDAAAVIINGIKVREKTILHHLVIPILIKLCLL